MEQEWFILWGTIFLSTLFTIVIFINIFTARKHIVKVQLQTTTWIIIALGCFVFFTLAYLFKPDFGGYFIALLASTMLITSNTSEGISHEGFHVLLKGSVVKRLKWDKIDHAKLINEHTRTRLRITMKNKSSIFPKPTIQQFYLIEDYKVIYQLFEEKNIRFDI